MRHFDIGVVYERQDKTGLGDEIQDPAHEFDGHNEVPARPSSVAHQLHGRDKGLLLWPVGMQSVES